MNNTALQLTRPPQTPEELWWTVKALFNIQIPNHQNCPHHQTPFQAFSDAYFGNQHNWALWYGSRGTGKSYLLALLALVKASLLEIDITLLGGSMAQSNNVREHVEKLMDKPNAPRHMIESMIQTEIKFTPGNWIRPLPASQKTVRGPHPSMTLLDEIDEMDKKIYDAAMGQALEQPNKRGITVPEMVVASSTWQNPIGCMILGTQITTITGNKNIENVQPGDKVLTRNGYKTVLGSWDMGLQPTIAVSFASGRTIRCTPWHPVWTDAFGWVRADSLTPGLHVGTSLFGITPRCAVSTLAHQAAQTSTVRAENTMDSQVMTFGALPGTLPEHASPNVVFSGCDKLEVAGIDAVTPATQVINVNSVGDRSINLHPHPPVSGHHSGVHASVALGPVTAAGNMERPWDAVIGVQIDGMVFSEDEVVDVSHVPMVLPTWDLTVEETSEYVANGVLVHNTFQQVIDDARQKNLPIFTWCWKEVIEPHGWMSPAFIERKKASVPAEMFRVEYELGEPAGDARAFDLEKVEATFIPMDTVGGRHAANDDEWIIEHPVKNASYAAGADWAKMHDKTVIVVARVDTYPRKIVYVRSVNRRSWPEMIGMFNDTINRYNAVSAHDATGLGNVVHDLVDERTLKVELVGGKRTKLLTEYISDFEQGAYVMPRNTSLYNAHRGCRVDDVFTNSTSPSNSHLPDEVAACAIMHRAAERIAPPVAAIGVNKTSDPPSVSKPFQTPARTAEVYVKADDAADGIWVPSSLVDTGDMTGVFNL